MKQALFTDRDFIPDVVSEVNDLVNEELPIIDGDFISKVGDIFNKAIPHKIYNITNKEEVLEFLEKWKGYKCFIVSW